MNKKNYLIERILSLDPVSDIIKAMKFAQILFNIDDKHVIKYKNETQTLSEIENNVLRGINLDLCFEIFFTYKNYNFKNIINHKTKKGKIIKIPMYELRAALRKVYHVIIELISGDFSIGESGDISYKSELGESFE